MKPAVVWFRRDLRLHDHPALTAAREGGRPVACLFVVDERLIHGRLAGANRVAFMLETLYSLSRSIAVIGGSLSFRTGQPEKVVPAFAHEAGASDVYASRDYGPYARRRDDAVAKALAGGGVAFHTLPGTLVHEPEAIAKDDSTGFAVYSPFRRRWEALPRRKVLLAPDSITPVEGLDTRELPTLADLGFTDSTAALPVATEVAARDRLARWVEGGLSGYGESRNLLAKDGTSRLSPYLRWGLLSPVEVVDRAATHGPAAATFTSEVVWREFYYHVLWRHPRVVSGPFLRQFDGMTWRDDDCAFEAWKAGRTGYPVVDAAMRQLLATGWMHNRARMITASFLAKHLLLDWRRGEAWFMQHLVDGDVANNNGGWQWSASTGTDSQPYFRVFNPVLQGKKFDAEGAYVRRWVPELASVPLRYIHEPWAMPEAIQRQAGCVIGREYPAPIVEHRFARERALAVYRSARAEVATPPARKAQGRERDERRGAC